MKIISLGCSQKVAANTSFRFLQLEGALPRHQVKHLVVDEIQDYTPVQYRVLARLFPCKKTILGDYNQSVNPLSSSSAEAIRDIFSGAECMFMNKSYPSTIEITELAQRINRIRISNPSNATASARESSLSAMRNMKCDTSAS